MPSTPIPNYAFRNNHDLTFTNETKNWGLEIPSFSNGTAYGDLDNDGDLDLVINNMNMPSFVYKNNSNNNYLKLDLKGNQSNTFAIGTIAELYVGNQIIKQELIPSRGFQSSIDYVMTFGLANNKNVDSLKIIWPNKKVSQLGKTKANQTITLNIENAIQDVTLEKPVKNKLFFNEIKQELMAHQEDSYIDFNHEGLIPKMLSKEGPALAIADVNNDGNEDVFIGGAFNQKGQLYLQDDSGNLIPSTFASDAIFEDTCSVFVDLDNDGDQDLLVGSGGNFKNARTGVRAYMNDSTGNFGAYQIVSRTNGNVSAIAPNDFDNDGDIDLFVACLSIPGIYGIDPENVLLENNGKGFFKNVTSSKAEKTKSIGMSTDAIWNDIDKDGKDDLIIVGEWMSPKIYKNTGQKLEELTTNLSEYSGMYNTVEASDLDGDGDIDLVLGNRGLNSIYKATKESPAKMFVHDFDKNGTIEQIFTKTINNKDVPIHLKREITGQITSLKKQNLKFSEYATKSIDQLFTKQVLENARVKTISTFASLVAFNNGDGSFIIKELPREAQLSCICKIKCEDINKDGIMDLILAGNNFNYKPQFSRLDANQGLVLFGNNKRNFINESNTGFKVKGEVKEMEWYTNKKGKRFLIVGINNEQPKIFELND
jgi:hypothetical protein